MSTLSLPGVEVRRQLQSQATVSDDVIRVCKDQQKLDFLYAFVFLLQIL